MELEDIANLKFVACKSVRVQVPPVVPSFFKATIDLSSKSSCIPVGSCKCKSYLSAPIFQITFKNKGKKYNKNVTSC